MKTLSLLLAAALALGCAAPALAGGDHAKCDMSVEECLAYYAKKAGNYGWVGIELDEVELSGSTYMSVKKVVAESPAAQSGFQVKDVLFALNGVELIDANKEKIKEVRGDWTPGQKVQYTLRRGNKDVKVDLTLGQMPREVLAQIVGEHMLEMHSQLAANE
jgi:C-terminal processing protease CtpA/Prc